MSTHIEEMILLQEVAKKLGGQVDLIRDDEGVSGIAIMNVPGVRDHHASPLAGVEALRRAIGREARRPSLSKDDEGNKVVEYSLQQCKAYSGGLSLVRDLLHQFVIEFNEKFIARHPDSFNQVVTHYCANIDGDLKVFDSKDDFDRHNPGIIKTKLHWYRYDISYPDQKERYLSEIKELKYQGIKKSSALHPRTDQARSFYGKVEALDNQDVLLETKYIFKNQWNSQSQTAGESGLRLMDWHEFSYPNKNIKEGYYLDQTDYMRHLRRSLDRKTEPVGM